MSKLLNKHINILKDDIQNLIDKIQKQEDSELIKLKESKKIELQNSIIQLNTLLQIEKQEKNDKEIEKISKTMDNLEYQKVRNNPNRNEIILNIKEKRIKAKDNYNILKQIESDYIKIDPREFPAFLFFDKTIINKYGLCPYIIPISEETLVESAFVPITENQENNYNKDTTTYFLNNRIEWLQNTNDKGKLYYDLFDKIINELEIKKLVQSQNNLDLYFTNCINDIFTESQHKLYKESIQFLKEYIECNIKTKKIKEKYKIVINNISTLVIETNLNVNTYLSLIYSCDIPINNLPTTQSNITFKFISDSFNEKLLQYKEIKNSISSNIKFIKNTKNNLELELYEYLFNKPKNIIKPQIGKFFNKKLSSLTIDEKNDRFESFADYFVNKHLISTNLLQSSKKNDTITFLLNLLKKSHNVSKIKKIKKTKQHLKLNENNENKLDENNENKLNENNENKNDNDNDNDDKKEYTLKYKNIRWNNKNGVIDKITTLQWDDIKQILFIEDEIKPVEIVNIKSEYDTVIPDKSKKISSIKTILTKQNEKIINEEIIKYILIKNVKDNSGENSNELKNNFIDIIKLKLKLKRITNNDKISISKKFDEIYNFMDKY